jgi:hypothetical protein
VITLGGVSFLEALVMVTGRSILERAGRLPRILGIALTVSICIAPGTAAAEPTIAADLDYTLPIDQSHVSPGFGFGARVGQFLEGPSIGFTPELGFGYASFTGDLGPKVYRGVGGFRLGIGDFVRPGIFGHAGIARLNVSTTADRDFSRTAFTYDIGAFLDVSVMPHLTVGAHFAYDRVHDSSRFGAFAWGAFGAHAALIF